MIERADALWRGTDRRDHHIPQTPDEVVALLERRIEVHAWWRDNGTKDAEKAGVGTPASHQAYISQYRGAITVIRGMQERGDDGG